MLCNPVFIEFLLRRMYFAITQRAKARIIAKLVDYFLVDVSVLNRKKWILKDKSRMTIGTIV